MDRIESGSPRELGERLTCPRREAAACETWRVTVEAALNRMVSACYRHGADLVLASVVGAVFVFRNAYKICYNILSISENQEYIIRSDYGKLELYEAESLKEKKLYQKVTETPEYPDLFSSKWLVAGSFAFAALWKRDAEIMWAMMGALVNTMLSSILKKLFSHERPAPALRSDPGMPSSHAQSIFYAAVFLVLSVFYWLGTNYLAVILGATTITSASYLSWLRVSHRLHTLNQILVGAIVGSAFGALWFALWHLLVHEAFDSSQWVQVPIILGSVAFGVACVVHIIRR